MKPRETQRIALAITGASGTPYGLRLLECLLGAGKEVFLLVSQAGQVVLKMEAGIDLPPSPSAAEANLRARFGCPSGQLRVLGRQQWTAPVASGTNPADAMVVCPCTTGTLATIASGACNDLIDRAADVVLKERRPLILVVRETPLSVIHLENMVRLARAGALILPANPGFYFRPQRVEDLVDFLVARILDHLGVAHQLLPRWGEGEG